MSNDNVLFMTRDGKSIPVEQAINIMELHEEIYVNNEMQITRVPAGWIYDICRGAGDLRTSTYVPDPYYFDKFPV